MVDDLLREMARRVAELEQLVDHRTEHRRRIINLRKGQMKLLFPAEPTPEEADPFIAARSSDGKWRVMAHLHLSESGDFFIGELEVTSWDGSDIPLGTTTLRGLPIGRWSSEAQAWLAGLAQRGVDTGRGGAQLKRLAGSKLTPKLGPRGFGRDFYRQLALAYLELQAPPHNVARGMGRRLAKESEERFGRKLDETQVRDALQRATELELITPGTRGRVGRQPGPNLFTEED